jgi:hypothetical protein
MKDNEESKAQRTSIVTTQRQREHKDNERSAAHLIEHRNNKMKRRASTAHPPDREFAASV